MRPPHQFYRSLPEGLVDAPEFHQLTASARLTYLIMRLSMGPIGIGVHYANALTYRLVEQTGLSHDDVTHAQSQLEQAGLLQREGTIVWVVKQLADEPSRSPNDVKQHTHVQMHIGGLPNTAIVQRFREYYTAYFPEQSAAPEPSTRTTTRPLPGPSKALPRPPEAAVAVAVPKQEHTNAADASVSTLCGKPVRERREPTGSPDYTPEFEQLWSRYPKRTGGNPKAVAFDAWKLQRKAGVPADELLAGVERYRAYCVATKNTGTVYVQQATSFLGRNRGWEESWATPAATTAVHADEFDGNGTRLERVPEVAPALRAGIGAPPAATATVP